MAHIVFFSYARENLDRYLSDFFQDLCEEIAPFTIWAAHDENISFHDKKNIRTMSNWKSEVQTALQSAGVLVCVTSLAYFTKEYCGREYYFFDQRRRQSLAAGSDPPPTILPVIWAPVPGGLPGLMSGTQYIPKGIPDSYSEKGLRFLKRFDRNNYNRCVTALAISIVSTWKDHRTIKPLQDVHRLDDIPNAFAEYDWHEAAGPGGSIPGPDVANFVFAVGVRDQLAEPPGRYGDKPASWRPYLPPIRTSILEYARAATDRQRFRFREIPVDPHLIDELQNARSRKNLTLVLADLRSLLLDDKKPIESLETVRWDGLSLLVPCNQADDIWNDAERQRILSGLMPIIMRSENRSDEFLIRSDEDLRATLDAALSRMRTAVLRSETEKKRRTDNGPPRLRGNRV